jgi:hypothetical protein
MRDAVDICMSCLCVWHTGVLLLPIVQRTCFLLPLLRPTNSRVQLPVTFQVLVSVQFAVYPAPVAFALQLAVHTLPFTVVLAQVASGNPALLGASVSAGAVAHSLAAAGKLNMNTAQQ